MIKYYFANVQPKDSTSKREHTSLVSFHLESFRFMWTRSHRSLIPAYRRNSLRKTSFIRVIAFGYRSFRKFINSLRWIENHKTVRFKSWIILLTLDVYPEGDSARRVLDVELWMVPDFKTVQHQGGSDQFARPHGKATLKRRGRRGGSVESQNFFSRLLALN